MPASHFRILRTCFSRSWGGLELTTLEITDQLRARGHTLWLATLPESRLAEEARRRGIPLFPLNIHGYFHPLLASRLAAFLRTNRIEIIHSELSKDLATLVPAAKLAGRKIPIILTKQMGSYISKRDILHRFTYANVDRVLAISEVIRKNVLETTTMPPDRVLTLHHAIDTDFFSPRQGNRARVRAQFGYDERNVVVGFVGRFSPGKGHEDLLNAIPLVRPQCPALRVLVVGEASYGEHPYAESIRSLSHNLGLDAIVTFAGYRSDVPDIMASFDILAFPSHAESFGVVLIEAMAMERPVVSTNCDGVIDIVVDGRTGIFVEPRNPRQLASALLRLIEDPALRDRMGKEGRKRVVDLFDRRKQIDRLEAVYEEVLKPVTHLPAARS